MNRLRRLARIGLAVAAAAARAATTVVITNGDLAVEGTSTSLTALIDGPVTNYPWYEVREGRPDGTLRDFGAHPTSAVWGFTVRHLHPGTNWVTVFAQAPGGAVASNRVRLTLEVGEAPMLRPRPHPAEIWWGGLSVNTQLVAAGAEWEFVKRFQDGYFFHSAGYGGLTDSDKRALAALLRPYNTRYWVELGGGCTTAAAWPSWQAGSGWGAHLASQQKLGLVMSEITHDYHMENLEDFCRANPSWPASDQLAFFTGDLTDASPAYPRASGQWKDAFVLYHQRNPHLKIGITSSPVWWGWDAYPGLGGNNVLYDPLLGTNGLPVLVGGQPVTFSFNPHDVLRSFTRVAAEIGHPYFAFASDCPWDYFGAWGNAADAAVNREKIRGYERFLHDRGARHTLICNVSNADSYTNADEGDLYYKTSSLRSMMRHQAEGGRADRYLFESWYYGIPHAAAPETKPGSFANLALEAIKYLKGLRDTNGAPEALSLTVLSTGVTTVVRLQNLGDVECLPALTAAETGDPALSTRYLASDGRDVTAAMLDPEGWSPAGTLAPGDTLDLTVVSAAAAPSGKTVTIEAFWNPQDPAGLVRDRAVLDLPSLATGVKDNNALDLNLGASWTGGLAPGTGTVAVWNQVVTGATACALGGSAAWGGIRVDDPGGAVTVTGAGALTLGPGGIDLSRAECDLSISSAVALGAAQAWHVAAGRTLAVLGAVSGPASAMCTKDGPGVLRLGAAQVLPGPFVLAAGTMDLRGFSQSFGSFDGAAGARVLLGGATLTFGANGIDTALDSPISGAGNVVRAGTGALTVVANHAYTGWTAIQGGTVRVGDGGTNGGLGAGAITNQGTLVLRRGDDVVADIRGSGSLIHEGPGRLTLAGGGSRTFAALRVRGGTFAHTNGTLTINGSDNGAMEIERGAVFELGGGTVSGSFYTQLGSYGRGTMTMTGGTFNNSGEILFAYGGDGEGTLNLRGGTVNAHFVRLGNSAHSVLNLDGGTLAADRIFSYNAYGELNLNGGVLKPGGSPSTPWIEGNLRVAAVKDGGAIIDTGTRALVVAMPLSAYAGSTGGLTKSGSGTLTLTASNTLVGPVRILAGRLALSGRGSVERSEQLFLASGATVDVSTASNGTLRVPPAQVLAGFGTVEGATRVEGVLAPGDAGQVGRLNFRGPLELAGSLRVRIQGSNLCDQAQADGPVALSGRLEVTAPSGLTAGAQARILDQTGTQAASGAFDDLPEGGTVDAGGRSWRISYTGGDGNDAVLTALVSSNEPAVVSLAASASGSLPMLGSLALTAGVVDVAGNVTGVVFRVNGRLLALLPAGPYVLPFAGLYPGDYTFTAAALASSGAEGTSDAVRIVVPLDPVVLVATGSVWRYYDRTNSPGETWREPGFDDASWSSGVARLGYGGDGEVTRVASNRLRITTCFRAAFRAPPEGVWSGLTVRLQRDDGAVAFLNGTELLRSNMPTGTIGWSTVASAAVGGSAEQAWYAYATNAAILRPGTNVLAVEVHQNGTNSSDLGFDLELTAAPSAWSPALDIRRVVGSDDVEVRWPEGAIGHQLAHAVKLEAPVVWVPDPDVLPNLSTGQRSVVFPEIPGETRFFRLQPP